MVWTSRSYKNFQPWNQRGDHTNFLAESNLPLPRNMISLMVKTLCCMFACSEGVIFGQVLTVREYYKTGKEQNNFLSLDLTDSFHLLLDFHCIICAQRHSVTPLHSKKSISHCSVCVYQRPLFGHSCIHKPMLLVSPAVDKKYKCITTFEAVYGRYGSTLFIMSS